MAKLKLYNTNISEWKEIEVSASNIPILDVNNKVTAENTEDAIQEIVTNLITHTNNITTAHGGIVASSDVVTSATANKILKLDSNSKLPASVTGDSETVNGLRSYQFSRALEYCCDFVGNVPNGTNGAVAQNGYVYNLSYKWSLADGSRTTIATAPSGAFGVVGDANNSDYIYTIVYPGSGTVFYVYRYSISANTWTNLGGWDTGLAGSNNTTYAFDPYLDCITIYHMYGSNYRRWRVSKSNGALLQSYTPTNGNSPYVIVNNKALQGASYNSNYFSINTYDDGAFTVGGVLTSQNNKYFATVFETSNKVLQIFNTQNGNIVPLRTVALPCNTAPVFQDEQYLYFNVTSKQIYKLKLG